MRDLVRTRRRWLVALLGLMLVAASCAADDGASDTAASAMAEAQAAESDAGVALADAQAAAARAETAKAPTNFLICAILPFLVRPSGDRRPKSAPFAVHRVLRPRSIPNSVLFLKFTRRRQP